MAQRFGDRPRTATRRRCRCTAYHQNSVSHPRDASPERRRARLRGNPAAGAVDPHGGRALYPVNLAAGGGRTALARAKLNDGSDRLDDPRIIFRQEGPLSSGNHYGCRIAQASDGNLFVTLGEHFNYRDEAQNLGNHLGKIIRIAPDGSVPNSASPQPPKALKPVLRSLASERSAARRYRASSSAMRFRPQRSATSSPLLSIRASGTPLGSREMRYLCADCAQNFETKARLEVSSGGLIWDRDTI